MEMTNWKGAAGICINDQNEVLMVLQGPVDDEKKWGLPAGPIEKEETFEESCIREFFEVTGLHVGILKNVDIKKDHFDNADVSTELHYFLVEVVSGKLTEIEEDPWIQELVWQPIEKIETLELADPRELEVIKLLLQN